MASAAQQLPRMMKGLVYRGPNSYQLEDRAVPEIQTPTDAVIKMRYTSICGTDLHILKGEVPTVELGLVLGHEGVGTIVTLGSAVTGLSEGDTVLIAAITSCGTCPFCNCQNGGWMLGNKIDGTQAEYVRVPHASSCLYKLSPEADLRACVGLSDTLPTGMESGTINAMVQPASKVVIVGAGPIGLAVLMTSKLYTPSLVVVVDKNDPRLEKAKKLGADDTVNPLNPGALEKLDALSGGEKFDAVVEAVGSQLAFSFCQKLVAPGGHIASVGVHGQKVELELDRLWSWNIGLKTRLLDTVSIGTLVKLYQAGKIDPSLLFSHHFPFSRIRDAYQTFQNPSQEATIKVGIEF